MRRANTTFVNLRATLDDLDAAGRRVQAGRQKLRPFLAAAAPARPRRPADACATSANIIRTPGPNNDLDRADRSRRSPLAQHRASARCSRNGKQREGALPASAKALEQARPGARLRAALRARPHRLVRRLQPLRRLRRARRRQPRGAARQRRSPAANGVLAPIPPQLRQPVVPAARQPRPARPLPGRDRARQRSGSRRRDFPCDANAGAAGGPMRRVARHRRALLVIAGALWAVSRGARQRRVRAAELLGRARQRVRPGQRRRPEDRRRARGQDHRAQARHEDATARCVGIEIDKTGFGRPAHRRASASRARSR